MTDVKRMTPEEHYTKALELLDKADETLTESCPCVAHTRLRRRDPWDQTVAAEPDHPATIDTGRPRWTSDARERFIAEAQAHIDAGHLALKLQEKRRRDNAHLFGPG